MMLENCLLDLVNSPKDIKKMSVEELESLCAQIRGKLIEVVSQNGGHLASNLGTVELTVALHKVLNCPQDQIVWDVGHQSYTHKILTGRREKRTEFRGLRAEMKAFLIRLVRAIVVRRFLRLLVF